MILKLKPAMYRSWLHARTFLNASKYFIMKSQFRINSNKDEVTTKATIHVKTHLKIKTCHFSDFRTAPYNYTCILCLKLYSSVWQWCMSYNFPFQVCRLTIQKWLLFRNRPQYLRAWRAASLNTEVRPSNLFLRTCLLEENNGSSRTRTKTWHEGSKD